MRIAYCALRGRLWVWMCVAYCVLRVAQPTLGVDAYCVLRIAHYALRDRPTLGVDVRCVLRIARCASHFGCGCALRIVCVHCALGDRVSPENDLGLHENT